MKSSIQCEGIKCGENHFAMFCPVCNMIVQVQSWNETDPKKFVFHTTDDHGHSVCWVDEEKIEKMFGHLKKRGLKVVK